MGKITTALFDFDGVVANTEPLYDIFWAKIAEKYRIDIPDFPAKIKGNTLQRIFKLYFSDYSPEEHEKIAFACEKFEETMDFPEVEGAVHFLHTLKARGYQVGLVTSSNDAKMNFALKKMQLEDVFDTLVTANRITTGKPDPMCYLLAAQTLKVQPESCVVFEDSFSGIQAGTAAGMRVIGLATTNPEEAIREKVFAVVPDFRNQEKLFKLLSSKLI